VALMCGNRPEFAEVLYACQRAGLRYTPVNWHLTAEEAAYIVADCEAKALVSEASFAPIAIAAAAGAARPLALRLAIGGAIEGFDDYQAVLAAHSPEAIEEPALGTRMLYTSGTTGRPKGVRRPPIAVTARTATLTAARYAAGTGQLH